MMIHSLRQSPRAGFTLTELLVTVAVIVILSVIVIANLSNVRANSRDANRRSSLDTYATAMEQWRAISPDKSYFIRQLTGNCNVTAPVTQAGLLGGPGAYSSGTGAGCVGHNGGGAGRITRAGIPATATGVVYPTPSIAGVLREQGIMNAITTDPFDTSKEYNDDATRDFILVYCTEDGASPASPSQALYYALYASLERPVPGPEGEDAVAARGCARSEGRVLYDGSLNPAPAYNFVRSNHQF